MRAKETEKAYRIIKEEARKRKVVIPFSPIVLLCAKAKNADSTSFQRVLKGKPLKGHIAATERLCGMIGRLMDPDESMDICQMAYCYRGRLLTGEESVSDGTLLRHLEIIRDALKLQADRHPGPGRPEGGSDVDRLIVPLTQYFRLCLRGTRLPLPLYKAMAELIFATYGKRWAPESLKTHISELFSNEPRRLTFLVNPKDAEIVVDGVVEGKASDFEPEYWKKAFKRLKVKDGRHRLLLRVPGFESCEKDIDVYSPLLIEITLDRVKNMREVPSASLAPKANAGSARGIERKTT